MESVWISKKISMSIFIIPSLTQKNLCFWLQVYAHISNLVQPKFNQDKMEVLIIWVSNLLSTMGSKWKKSVIIFKNFLHFSNSMAELFMNATLEQKILKITNVIWLPKNHTFFRF